MASLYLDEDVPLDVVALLAAAGHQVTSARDRGNLNASDEAHLIYALERHMIMLTHNTKHFRRLHEAWIAAGRVHAGILTLDRPRGITAEAIAGHVMELLATSGRVFVGTFWRWRGNNQWRQYPHDR